MSWPRRGPSSVRPAASHTDPEPDNATRSDVPLMPLPDYARLDCDDANGVAAVDAAADGDGGVGATDAAHPLNSNRACCCVRDPLRPAWGTVAVAVVAAVAMANGVCATTAAAAAAVAADGVGGVMRTRMAPRATWTSPASWTYCAAACSCARVPWPRISPWHC